VISQKRFNRKAISGVIAAALVLTSLTACASSSPGGETTAREASSDTGRTKVCVKNETGSAFELEWQDGYLNENNQPITARQVAVAANGTQCAFSINGESINRSEVSFYMWRNESLRSSVRLSFRYQSAELYVVAPQMGTEDYFLYSDGSERKVDWLRGSLYASFSKTTETTRLLIADQHLPKKQPESH
jgi:hypothetical protein